MALAWTNGEATATTVIERSLNGSTGWVEIATKNAGVTSHNDTALGNATYYYRVRHLINSVYSSYSSNANGTISGGSSGGSLAVGGTITITGTGFGSGTTPVLFQDFESGSNGANLSTLGFQVANSNGCPDPVVTTSQHYAGTRCAFADCSGVGDSAAYVNALDTDDIYVSVHVKSVVTSGAPKTTKGVRAHGDIGPNIYTSYPGFMVQEPSEYSTNGHRFQVNRSNTSADYTVYYDPSDIGDDTWVRQQYHYRLGTAGTADGYARYWKNVTQELARNSIITRASGVTTKLNVLMMPFYFGNGGAGYWYYDLVCIHKGVNCAARVELGDAAAYSSCTKREILENVSWSDTSIQAKLHKHTFGTGTAWLHVIDASNNAVQAVEVTLS